MEFEIDVVPREKGTKGKVKNLRRLGDIPAVLYVPSKESENIAVNGEQFRAILRNMKNGHLATTVFLVKYKNESFKAIVKDINYETVSYDVIHLDLQRLDDKAEVTITVPIQYVGEDECAGIKLGGFLRKIVRGVKVKCLPKDIPAEFLIDVKNLGISDAKKISDIVMPTGVKAVSSLDKVAAVIAKH
jgi:large subunit ribosomal protein L25